MLGSLKIALIADTFPPLRNSGAVQLRDLAREFSRQGHELTVILPAADISEPWVIEDTENYRIIRLQAPRTKDINYFLRTIGEIIMPFAMLRNLRRSPLASIKWDGVIWYAPSIFHGPLASALKKKSGCKGYLIIRDIFPQWAVDMGLMRRGLPYLFFSAVARYQYFVADMIGVQTPGNLQYFARFQDRPVAKVEVLNNWLGHPGQASCPIRMSETSLAGRTIFVYAGNMGVAQGMDILLDLAERLLDRADVGFLFVGRGSEVPRLKAHVMNRSLSNVLFFDEIHPDEVYNLYSQCHVGIVALAANHKTHNIPGKFLTYMQAGLPVLANINFSNDLASIIREEQVGQVCESNTIDDLLVFANKLLEDLELDDGFAQRCHCVFERDFSVDKAARQVVASFGPHNA